MVSLNDVYFSLQEEGYYNKYFDLYIPDKPDKDEVDLLHQRLTNIGKEHLLTPNSVFLFGRSNRDVPFGTEFNILFSKERPLVGTEVNATLKYANAHPNFEYTVIPKGHTSVVCLIEFHDGIPEELNSINIYRQNKWDKNKTFYLTQKPIYERMRELMS